MRQITGVHDNCLAEILSLAEDAIARVEKLQRTSERPAGLRRLRLLHALLNVSCMQFRVMDSLHRMRKFLLSVDRKNMSMEQRAAYQRLGEEALTYARSWQKIMADNMADRGMEGTITSYERVVVRFIRKFLDLYGTERFADDDGPTIHPCSRPHRFRIEQERRHEDALVCVFADRDHRPVRRHGAGCRSACVLAN